MIHANDSYWFSFLPAFQKTLLIWVELRAHIMAIASVWASEGYKLPERGVSFPSRCPAIAWHHNAIKVSALRDFCVMWFSWHKSHEIRYNWWHEKCCHSALDHLDFSKIRQASIVVLMHFLVVNSTFSLYFILWPIVYTSILPSAYIYSYSMTFLLISSHPELGFLAWFAFTCGFAITWSLIIFYLVYLSLCLIVAARQFPRIIRSIT